MPAIANRLPRRPEHRQVVFPEPVLTIRPAQREHHALAQFACIHADGIGDEERAFVELENDGGVRSRVFVEVFAAERRPGKDLATPGNRGPLRIIGEALVA